MRVAFVSHLPNLTGAERILFNLASELAARGDDCLVAVGGYGPMLELPRPPRLGFLQIGGMPWYLPLPGDPEAPARSAREAGASAAELARGLRDWGAEVVVCNTLTNVVGLLAAARLGLPAVTWVHGVIDQHILPHEHGAFKAACDELLVRSAARVVCPSRWTANYVEECLGAACDVIPNATAIPAEPPPPPGGPTTFCCLNTWDPHKGLFTLLDAAALLRLRGADFRLDLYGDGAPAIREGLARRVEALDLGGVVRLRGRTSDTAAVYRGAHALVTAAATEPFGMTLIEAMAHGRPVVVSDTSGHREIVDGPHGVRCPVGDAAAFAREMLRLIEEPAEARRLGAAGRAVAEERYGLPLLAARFAALLREVAEAERGLTPAAAARRYAACRPLAALAS